MGTKKKWKKWRWASDWFLNQKRPLSTLTTTQRGDKLLAHMDRFYSSPSKPSSTGFDLLYIHPCPKLPLKAARRPSWTSPRKAACFFPTRTGLDIFATSIQIQTMVDSSFLKSFKTGCLLLMWVDNSWNVNWWDEKRWWLPHPQQWKSWTWINFSVVGDSNRNHGSSNSRTAVMDLLCQSDDGIIQLSWRACLSYVETLLYKEARQHENGRSETEFHSVCCRSGVLRFLR